MKKIMLQAGHKGTTTGSTGTAGEQELNWRITLKLSEILQQKGFQLYIVDANPPQEQLEQDFDFFLAIHGDWNSPSDGGCISAPDPSYDYNNTESRRIVEEVKKHYFVPYTNDVGITDRPNKITVNMTKYYMWMRLSAKTPCGIIELGEVMDAHDRVILADTERVATGIAKGICSAFGVEWETTPPPQPSIEPPVENCDQYKEEIKSLKAHIEELAKMIGEYQEQSEKDEETIKKLTTANKQLRLELTACENRECPDFGRCPNWLKRLNNYFCK